MKASHYILLALCWTGFSTPIFAKKVFRYSEDGAPTNFDPVEGGSIYANYINTAIYDTLYEYRYLKRPYTLKPNLAVGLPEVSKDGLTYTFKIKQGVRFADDPCFPDGKGRELVADDFVYSMKRNFDEKERSQGAWLWAGRIAGIDAWKKAGSDYSKDISGLRATDKYTIVITLKEPFPQLLNTLAMGYSGVVPKEAVAKYGSEIAVRPVGSGPWMLKSHNAKKTILVKNPNYRGDVFNAKDEGYDPALHGSTGIDLLDGKTLPVIDEVEVSWMKEQPARWNSFTKGNEIMWTVLQNEQIDEVLATKHPITLKPKFAEKYGSRTETEAGLIFVSFNMDNEEIGFSKDPERNKRNHALRCAIRKVYDWKKLINRFYLGIGEAYPGFIVPTLDGFSKNLARDSVNFDPTGAKKLLADNNWNPTNLPTLIYGGVAEVRTQQLFEAFRGSLTAIGYPQQKIKFQSYATFGDFSKDTKNRKVMLIPMGWGLDYPDAENTLALFYGPNQSPGANHANYVNPEYDKLFLKASTMQQGPARTALYEKLNQMIVDDCVTISAFSRTRVFMWHKGAVIWPQRDIVGNIFKYLDVR